MAIYVLLQQTLYIVDVFALVTHVNHYFVAMLRMGPAGDGHHEHGLNLSLWVKGELFTFGTVAGTPHPRLGFSNIRKMVTYCKNKGMKYAVYRLF